MSGFTVILPGLVQGHIIPESSSVWPASMFSLAVASTTLVFGRLADIYGGRRIYICGLVWLAVWSLVIGFAKNEVLLDLSRALQGIGASAMLPSGLMMMGRIYRPGKRKNIVFSIYGVCAPFGFLSLFAERSEVNRDQSVETINVPSVTNDEFRYSCEPNCLPSHLIFSSNAYFYSAADHGELD